MSALSALRRRMMLMQRQSQKHYADRIIPDVRINHPGSIAVRSGQNTAEFLVQPNTRYKITRIGSAMSNIWRKGESNIQYVNAGMQLNNYYNISQGLVEYEFTTASDSYYLYVWSSDTTTATSIWITPV